MSLSTLHADIAARYDRLNQSISKGAIAPEQAAVLSDRYAWPVSKDALGMARTGAAQVGGVNRNDFSIPFVISTQAEDRDGDVVRSLGGEVGAYAGNPIIFFGHQSWQIPIGVARSSIDAVPDVRMQERQVLSRCWFDQPDEDAMFIFGKVERGILNAASISFLPIQAYRREQRKAHSESMTPPGWFFERWELTEWSVVGIGANAGALRDSLDQEKSFIRPRLVKALQPFAAVAKGRCFSGYCPCPPCEEADMSVKTNAAVLTSGLPGAKKACHKSYCKCKTCKSGKTKKELPEQANATSGSEAAGNDEARHEHEEEGAEDAKSLQESVQMKMPKLMECGYTEAQSMCLGAHHHSKGNEGDDITGHEEAAKALGYTKDDAGGEGGMEGESMSLKSHVKSIQKESEGEALEESSEGETESASEGEEADDSEEEEPQYKPSAKWLGHMHNHMQKGLKYTQHELPMMDHEKMCKAMTAHCKDLEGHMENYKSLADIHHPDVDFDKMCKSLAGEGGEAETEENETGAGAADEASSEEGDERHGTKKDPKELVQECQNPKGGKGGKQKSQSDLTPEVLQAVAERTDRLSDMIFRRTGQRF